MDQEVQDTRKIIRSDYRVNDFELEHTGTGDCPVPEDGVGYLSIIKPTQKAGLEIRHNWLAYADGDTHTFTLLCTDGSFEEAGYAYDIDHNGDCTVTERHAGVEWQYTCPDVQFHVDIDPF